LEKKGQHSLQDLEKEQGNVGGGQEEQKRRNKERAREGGKRGEEGSYSVGKMENVEKGGRPVAEKQNDPGRKVAQKNPSQR